MFKWIKCWQRDRKAAKAEAQFKEGFDWAAGSLLRGEADYDSLMFLADSIEPTPFDEGIAAAANRVQTLISFNCQEAIKHSNDSH